MYFTESYSTQILAAPGAFPANSRYFTESYSSGPALSRLTQPANSRYFTESYSRFRLVAVPAAPANSRYFTESYRSSYYSHKGLRPANSRYFTESYSSAGVNPVFRPPANSRYFTESYSFLRRIGSEAYLQIAGILRNLTADFLESAATHVLYNNKLKKKNPAQPKTTKEPGRIFLPNAQRCLISSQRALSISSRPFSMQ